MKCHVSSTRSKSSIRPSFFSRSEFLLFSIAFSFSIVRSDCKGRRSIKTMIILIVHSSVAVTKVMQQVVLSNNIFQLLIILAICWFICQRFNNCILTYEVKSDQQPVRTDSWWSTCVALWTKWREAGFSEHDECSVLTELTDEGLPCCTWEAEILIQSNTLMILSRHTADSRDKTWHYGKRN